MGDLLDFCHLFPLRDDFKNIYPDLTETRKTVGEEKVLFLMHCFSSNSFFCTYVRFFPYFVFNPSRFSLRNRIFTLPTYVLGFSLNSGGLLKPVFQNISTCHTLIYSNHW